MKHNLCALMLFVALFSSCDRVPEHALQQAGDNRAELERALAHFKDGSSPEKYRAAKFLIEDMPYQLTYEGEGMELLDSAYLVMSEATVQTRNDVFKELTRDVCAFYHCHTTLNKCPENCQRATGPSSEDVSFATSQGLPGLVEDYAVATLKGQMSAGLPHVIIPFGPTQRPDQEFPPISL